jgi:hypothetical protein
LDKTFSPHAIDAPNDIVLACRMMKHALDCALYP